MSAVQVQADYAVKGRDYDTELVGPVTDDLIDAARMARVEFDNGFPNYAIYRLILCGDRMHMRAVRQWWVLFSIEWCRSHMRGGYSEELATVAAWDSLQRVIEPRAEILQAQDAADSLGVELETYTRARNSLRSILQAVLSHYWTVLGGMYRVVILVNRKSER